jgi:hypothetical protein
MQDLAQQTVGPNLERRLSTARPAASFSRFLDLLKNFEIKFLILNRAPESLHDVDPARLPSCDAGDSSQNGREKNITRILHRCHTTERCAG